MREPKADETLDDPPPQAVDRHRFGERFVAEVVVGSGGMGMVFRGRDLLDDSRVALKVLQRREGLAVERFAREAEILAGLLHPAIVRYVAHGRTLQSEPYLAMEWLDGESLADRLERKVVEPAAAARLGARILRALAVAHGQGIVHRDIKPSNLFLVNGELEQTKLLDFGIALNVRNDWQVTRPGFVPGTPLYLSPEQAEGSDHLDGRSDIFSLGCVLYECISGEAPSWRMVHGQPRWNEAALAELRQHAPEPLRLLLDGMIALAPASRPTDADALAAELAAVADALAAGPGAAVARARQTLSAEEKRSTVVLSISAEGRESLAGAGEAVAAAGGDVASDGEVLRATFPGSAIPADQAIRAARIALRLRPQRPAVALAIGMQPGLLSECLTPDAVHVDADTARLLEARFELRRLSDGHFELLFEKGVGEVPRTLMGKEVPCFGRQREIALLEGLWQEACETPVARALQMTAPAGAGKSRVRHELCEHLRAQGQPFELLIGRGDPMRDAAPFALLGPALLSAAGITGNEPEAVQRERLTNHCMPFLTGSDSERTLAFLGEIANLPFPDHDLPALQAARKDPRVMADQRLMAWLAWLEAVCARHPVLIVLEDLHWGDAPSVQLVDAALRVLAEKPLMVLAVARPEVERRFPSLWSGRSPQRLELPPLSSRWSQRLVEHVTGLSDDRSRWIVDRSQGNPFFLQELLRLCADGSRAGDDSALPHTVLGVVQARLDSFGPDAKLVLRAASIFGGTFRADGVRALLDRVHRRDVDHWLEILEKQEILYAPREGEHAFRHALLRQAAYDLLPVEEMRLGHRLAGQYLEASGVRDGTVLADHFERGGDNASAIHWLIVAAEQALAANDIAQAVAHAERGARLGASGEERCTLRLIEARARYWKGEYREAEEAAREAAATSDPKKKLEATTALIDALGPQAKYEEIASLYEHLDRPGEATLVNAWLDCVDCSTSYLGVGWNIAYLERMLELFETSREYLEPRLAGRMEFIRALIQRRDGRRCAAIQSWKAAAAVFEAAGFDLEANLTRANLAGMFLELGQFGDGETAYREVAAAAERRDLKHLLGGSLCQLSGVLASSGRLSEARACLQRARQLTSSQNDRRFQGYAEMFLSFIEYLERDYRAAESYAHSAIETLDPVPALRPLAIAYLAQALLAQSQTEAALIRARDAYAQLQQQGAVDDGEATIRLALAECLLATGDRDAAVQAVKSAADWLLASADKIDIPAYRESFLTRIPENRRILELARQVGIVGG